MVINTKLSDEELLKAIYKAAFEYSKLMGNSYLIIGKIRIPDIFGFNVSFKRNILCIDIMKTNGKKD